MGTRGAAESTVIRPRSLRCFSEVAPDIAAEMLPNNPRKSPTTAAESPSECFPRVPRVLDVDAAHT
jgi:hypothetical protein